jgi:diacylglycerol O-acyltransferase / wax synthase
MGIRMAPGDAAWYLGESPENQMTISTVLWFDRPLDVDRLKELMETRLLDRHPVMRQKVVVSPLHGNWPRWEDHRDFDLHEHVTESELPAPGDQATLEQVCSVERSTPLDRSRPLWHTSVHQGYRGDGSAAHVRIHHSVGDGLALMQLLLTLCDEYDPDAIRISDHSLSQKATELLGLGREMLATSTHVARHPTEAFDLTRKAVTTAAWSVKLLAPQMPERTVLQGHPEGVKRMVWDPDGFELDEVKAHARANGLTINDLLMAVMAGGLHRYLAAYDDLVDDVLVMIPVNLRSPGAPLPRHLGNKIGLLPLRLPVGIDDPLERVRVVRARIDALKDSPAPVLSRTLMAATSMSVPAVVRGIHRINQIRGTGVVTNVPGPREPLHITGARLLGTIGWGGMTGHLNLSVAFISLAGRIFPGMVTDVAITDDPDRVLADVQAEYRELLDSLPGEPVFTAG